jgi:hypothetical protein
MRALSATELLRVWEAGATQTAAERALTLLAAASPEMPLDSLARLSIGRRDTLLFILRAWMFGSGLVGLAQCSACAEQIELTFDTADILSKYEQSRVEEFSLSMEDCQVRFRLPTSNDLIALSDATDIATFRNRLLEHCLVAAQLNGQPVSASNLPSAAVKELVEQIGRADPQGDIQMILCCSSCKRELQAALDIVSFFWTEINSWAMRMLREIHSLASTYGWTESDILAMSAARRQVYLELVQA